jgi:hypothetical protein
MVQVFDNERREFPRLTSWISSNLRLVADDPTVWPAFRTASGLAEAWARDAVSGGIKSPVLAVGELGNRDSAFDPARPTEIWLAARLARSFEARPAIRDAQVLVTGALLAQIVAWSALRARRPNGRDTAIQFLTTAYPVPPNRGWIEVAQDDGTFTIQLTESDIDDLSRITWGEARGEPREGRAGVIFVVLNRVASTEFPHAVRAVIDQRNQFEPVSNTASKSVVGLPAPPAGERVSIAEIIEEIAAGTIQDPTNGATFFQNVATTRARGTEFAQGVPPVAEIGHHSFFDRFSADHPVAVARWRATTPTSRAESAPEGLTAGFVV